jgi:nitrogen regulatory protein PII-like uncharacterized protein
MKIKLLKLESAAERNNDYKKIVDLYLEKFPLLFIQKFNDLIEITLKSDDDPESYAAIIKLLSCNKTAIVLIKYIHIHKYEDEIENIFYDGLTKAHYTKMELELPYRHSLYGMFQPGLLY